MWARDNQPRVNLNFDELENLFQARMPPPSYIALHSMLFSAPKKSWLRNASMLNICGARLCTTFDTSFVVHQPHIQVLHLQELRCSASGDGRLDFCCKLVVGKEQTC